MKVKAVIALEAREEYYPAAARVKGAGSERGDLYFQWLIQRLRFRVSAAHSVKKPHINCWEGASR